MTKYTNPIIKPIPLTNQDVIDFISSIGLTVKTVTVDNDQVMELETVENVNAAKDTQIRNRFPELV